ncbi:protein of unknown function [Methanosarcina thermophila]|uniref:DUF3786 domain-containing protein n=3 Tax=Methanosarcina thermophila TaxID=2210 RepID=A0A1I7AT99_METTE|nr:DUF3786 domain-containing protein [Methanosarcina thermophila]AKB13047.1 hypothetical protein MSTHT_1289 [Methanosarcina thermophila TM-1]AKB16315.1 hypothetical protein MSTHC_1997 [Methanosarcina thermophila CHTI-55]NLU56146.1 DUF3786 domain-containing protein [Methanosarcina thermophila]SFT78181.1 protein of unknown function [Methanosarcina thermophila]BAW28031.1 conserved hypothetical protein [Methanosarcina thermophila]
MTYEIALNKAWDEIAALAPSQEYTVKFLTDIYEVKINDKIVLMKPSDVPASEEISVLILRYLIGILKHGYIQKGEWISFKELKGGPSYYPAYQKNTIKPILKSLKENPDSLIKNLTERFGGKLVEGGDVSVELVTFPDVRVRFVFWFADKELPPEATILFDRELTKIFTTEEIAALMFFLAMAVLDNSSERVLKLNLTSTIEIGS